ncbi:hypothetical protein [Acetivibrio ethanolgignens]|uniref:Uncharacterized protein n=1 Tax=Acetivibrio ethanolgignens TaxID=290052 RepID=A0A0V8QEW0_9FIRM|nr:hypothetical protein [Acetivibrio ethanolgignens]KSV59128.1 hypothetical protein ASU35_10230 [Acetivibrio ethanolgignens]
MLTELQTTILKFAKSEAFHATLNDFICSYHVDADVALDALKDLRRKRIVSVVPSLTCSWIGVTNYGWKIMGWEH